MKTIHTELLPDGLEFIHASLHDAIDVILAHASHQQIEALAIVLHALGRTNGDEYAQELLDKWLPYIRKEFFDEEWSKRSTMGSRQEARMRIWSERRAANEATR